MARFLENHDEPRAAAEFLCEKHKAAAVLTYFSPGLRFFHQGQLEGKKKRISPHLVRGPKEPGNDQLQAFYRSIIKILNKPVFLNGRWQLLDCTQAWNGNHSNENYISFAWQGDNDEIMLVVVNYSPQRAQCRLMLPFPGLRDKSWLFHDLVADYKYTRDGNELQEKGLFLDEPAWRIYIFTLKVV
jgi:hypothetical protein